MMRDGLKEPEGFVPGQARVAITAITAGGLLRWAILLMQTLGY